MQGKYNAFAKMPAGDWPPFTRETSWGLFDAKRATTNKVNF